MTKHLLRDLENLKKQLLMMGSMVEQAIDKSMLSLAERRPDLAEDVAKSDDEIDQKENQIEEECLKLLALHQPVAADLRLVVGVLKVNNDLERMGDLAINIAERSIYLASQEPLNVVLDFPLMIEGVREMVKGSLDALVNENTDTARKVLEKEPEIDEVNRQMFVVIQDVMRKEPDTVDRAVQLLSASRYLERIADLATNIAEDVVFMVEGDLIRHRS